jgi:hypothetical protein
MAQLPAVAHIALTVTDLTVTDLAVSVPWYERLLGTKPVLDEDTAGYHHTVYQLPAAPCSSSTSTPRPPATRTASTSTAPAWTTSRSGSPTGRS